MQGSTIGVVGIIIASFSIAGCVGGSAGGEAGGFNIDPGADDPNKGTVAGVVTNEELVPLASALVAIDPVDGPTAKTDEAGRFVIQGVEPGERRIEVLALGHHSVGRVIQVTAGQTTNLQFQLATLPVIKPYMELFILEGYSTCDISLFLSVTTYDGVTGQPCPLGSPKRSVIQQIQDSWRYGVVEMVWKTADSFALYIAENRNCTTGDPCYGIKFGGTSPLRLDMAPGDEELAKQWSSDGKDTYPEGSWKMHANVIYIGMYRDVWGSVTDEPVCRGALNYKPGCPSWGASTGIPFTIYASVFHWEGPELPQAYSALPDR